MSKRKSNQRSRAPEETAPVPESDRLWIGLIVLGIVLRIGLALISIGTNDAAAWLRFGDEINREGLLKTYKIDSDFNHPPIPGYWAALCAKLAGDENAPLHDSKFTVLFKLAAIAGDCLGIYVLYLIWKRRRGKSYGLFVAAMFALSLNAIAVSGFHCNTDPLLIALCLLALYLLDGRRVFLAGVALAAAINVKIIPVLLIVPLLLQMRKWRDAGVFVGGLAVGVIPFISALLNVREQFITNAVKYNSVLDRWGINYFLLFGREKWVPGGRGEQVSWAYYSRARYLILGLIAAWAIWARVKPRWSFTEIALVTFAIFLLLAPGFGVQYTVLPGLLLMALRPRWGIMYGAVAGLFVSAAYFVNWKGSFPLYSQWSTLFPEPVAVVGLATWVILIAVVVHVLARPVPRDVMLT
jgi:hypothetical protein